MFIGADCSQGGTIGCHLADYSRRRGHRITGFVNVSDFFRAGAGSIMERQILCDMQHTAIVTTWMNQVPDGKMSVMPTEDEALNEAEMQVYDLYHDLQGRPSVATKELFLCDCCRGVIAQKGGRSNTP